MITVVKITVRNLNIYCVKIPKKVLKFKYNFVFFIAFITLF